MPKCHVVQHKWNHLLVNFNINVWNIENKHANAFCRKIPTKIGIVTKLPLTLIVSSSSGHRTRKCIFQVAGMFFKLQTKRSASSYDNFTCDTAIFIASPKLCGSIGTILLLMGSRKQFQMYGKNSRKLFLVDDDVGFSSSYNWLVRTIETFIHLKFWMTVVFSPESSFIVRFALRHPRRQFNWIPNLNL